jgi:hypothetical protein
MGKQVLGLLILALGANQFLEDLLGMAVFALIIKGFAFSSWEAVPTSTRSSVPASKRPPPSYSPPTMTTPIST